MSELPWPYPPPRPPLFDSHCHLNHPRFDADRAEALRRARLAGVREFLVIGYDPDSSRRAVEMVEPDAGLLAAVGVHPHEAASWSSETERAIRCWVRQPGVVAIGEIGLDFYRDLAPRDLQETVFRAQLDLAAELSLPVVIHTRESVTPALDLLEPYARRGLRGILHCWSGSQEEAERACALGFLLGIGGVVTYGSAHPLPDVVRRAPAESLALETDAPYLPPVPYRGRRNEPAFLPWVAARVAELRGTDVQTVARQTRENARRLLAGTAS